MFDVEHSDRSEYSIEHSHWSESSMSNIQNRLNVQYRALMTFCDIEPTSGHKCSTGGGNKCPLEKLFCSAIPDSKIK